MIYNIILILLCATLGFYVALSIKHKRLIKSQRKTIKKQEEVLQLYRETVVRYQTMFNGEYRQEINIPKEESYDLDEILIEISEKGIKNISIEKLKFLKNFKK